MIAESSSKRVKRRVLISVVVVLAGGYVTDYLVLHYRGQPRGSVIIQRYDAIAEKNNKTEFDFEAPITQSCVHSVFPHMGYEPCWYLARHSEQRINY